jgi:uncharacterized membrane protein HdeD (DUF308 family)
MASASDPVNVEVRGPNPWLPLVVIGVLTLGLGIWLIVSAIVGTNFSVGVIAFLLAMGLFLSGLTELAFASGRPKPWMGYALGGLFIVGGIIVLINPAGGLTALAVAIGIVLIVVGLFQAAMGIMGRDELRHWAAVTVFGLLTIGIGIAAIAWPEATARVLALLFGIRLLVVALGTIGIGWDLKRLA